MAAAQSGTRKAAFAKHGSAVKRYSHSGTHKTWRRRKAVSKSGTRKSGTQKRYSPRYRTPALKYCLLNSSPSFSASRLPSSHVYLLQGLLWCLITYFLDPSSVGDTQMKRIVRGKTVTDSRAGVIGRLVETPRGCKFVETPRPPPVDYPGGPPERIRKRQLEQYRYHSLVGKLKEELLLRVFSHLSMLDTTVDNQHAHPILPCLRVCCFWRKVASNPTLWTRIYIGCSAACTETYLTRSYRLSLSVHCPRVRYRTQLSCDAPARLVRRELDRVEEVHLEDEHHSGRVAAILAGMRGPHPERLRILEVIMDHTQQSVWPDADSCGRFLLDPEHNLQHLRFQGILSKSIVKSIHGLRSLTLGNIFKVSPAKLLRAIARCPFLEILQLDVLRAEVLAQEYHPA